MTYNNAKYKTESTFTVKTYEIDAAGHVNNIVYIKWLEDLRCELFNKYCSIDELMHEFIYPVIVSTNIYYKKALKLSDQPDGFIWVDEINHGLIKLNFEFKIDDELFCSANQKCVIMNLLSDKMETQKAKEIFP